MRASAEGSREKARPAVRLPARHEKVQEPLEPGDASSNDEPYGDAAGPSEKALLLNERFWLQRCRSLPIFVKLETILRECCECLRLTNKVDSSLRLSARPSHTEKVFLTQRGGFDAFKATVMLLGENIIQTEVTMKYPKMPGGVFRSSAQPDVQWKLQQLQDAGNYCAQALSTVVKGRQFITEKCTNDDEMASESAKVLSAIIAMTCDCVGQARSSLCLPRKRTLLELCSFPPMRCFNPPLPPDLVFSYYVAATRIVCAAYHMTPKPNGTRGLTATLAECSLPHLVTLLRLLNRAVSIIQDLRFHLRTFDALLKTFPDEDSQTIRL